MTSSLRAEALAADVAALRADLKSRGFYERPAGRVLRTWLLSLLVAAAGMAGFVFGHGLLAVAALAVSTLGTVALATVGHTASHNALSRSRGLNRFLYHASYPFLLQVSARYWLYSHVQVHHPAPTVLGVDHDCDLRPTFALNDQHMAGAALPRSVSWLQGLLLLLALPFNGFNIQRQGWARLLHELRDPALRTPEAWLDLACLVLHLAVFVLLPMAFFPVSAVLLVHALRVSSIGILLFAVLAPGHYPAEAACLDLDQRDAGDFYLRQTVATVNFRTGLFGRWLCSGLEYQIEHHLFPSISHVHYPAMSPLVRAFCQRQGLPYRVLGWGEAVAKSYAVFLAPKRVRGDVESLRLTAPLVTPPTARPVADAQPTSP